MNKFFRNVLVMSTILTLAAQGFARSRATDISESSAVVHVRIFNYAEASPRMMGNASGVAARILRAAGVETIWHDCALSAEQRQKDAACKRLPGPTHLVLRLIPRSMAKGYGLHHSRFGIAMPARNGGFGLHASVFFHSRRGTGRQPLR